MKESAQCLSLHGRQTHYSVRINRSDTPGKVSRLAHRPTMSSKRSSHTTESPSSHSLAVWSNKAFYRGTGHDVEEPKNKSTRANHKKRIVSVEMGIRNRSISTVPLSGRFRSPFGCCQAALQPFFAFNLSMLNQSSQAVEVLTPNFSAQLQENQRCTQSFLLTPLLGRLQDPTDCTVHQERSSCQAKRSENKAR